MDPCDTPCNVINGDLHSLKHFNVLFTIREITIYSVLLMPLIPY